MVLIKILKRKDGSTILVAILLAFIISQTLTSMTMRLATVISRTDNNGGYGGPPGSGWKNEYLFPLTWMVLQILVLEVLARMYIFLASNFKKKS